MKKIMLFLLVLFSVFITNVYANTEGYETTGEEKLAREKLHHCKLFDCVDDKDFMIDSIINSNANKLSSARAIINMLKEDVFNMYQDMENNYANSKKNGVSSVASIKR